MKIPAFVAFGCLIASSALAQERTFNVNTDASEVKMKLNTTHEVVNGIFHVSSGVITFDPAASHISGMVVVAAGSGKTGNGSRDKKMDQSILKIDQFNTVSFAPASYSGTLAAAGESTVQVRGVFTLLGIAHDLTVPMHISINGSRATATGKFIVPYVEWGLKNPSFLIWKADDTVGIDLNLVGQLSK